MQMKWLEGNLKQSFKFFKFAVSVSKVVAYEQILTKLTRLRFRVNVN